MDPFHLAPAFTVFPLSPSLSCSSSHPALDPSFLPGSQFSYVRAHCSASALPRLSWRRSISRERGVRTLCRQETGYTSCPGRPTGQRCCTSTPRGMTTDRTGSPLLTSESDRLAFIAGISRSKQTVIVVLKTET